ncbi:DsrE/DsrF/DrsH-like family protein [uncultured Imperialibacter sp.]|uniref:DsrE/DsrF/DrsH-like family protein n=1 Tax=uncultured Imperialibacter sp. TaxID=1672639 RepID=UPI0030DB1F4B|tara:strand:+ start:3467 stop:3979 length:513 start_codon:yes stop_codon:yes gene_type:complete
METVEAPVKAPAKKEKKLRKIMIINSKATIDSVYAALILANGARMEGIESEIFCTFFGLEMLQKEKMDHLHVATVGNPGLHIPTMIGGLPGMETLASAMMRKEMDKLDIPPVSEFLEIYKASGGKVFACKLAMEMFHLEKKDLWDDLDDVLTVGDFYNRADEDGTQIIFV